MARTTCELPSIIRDIGGSPEQSQPLTSAKAFFHRVRLLAKRSGFFCGL